jgi:hypothetical protein
MITRRGVGAMWRVSICISTFLQSISGRSKSLQRFSKLFHSSSQPSVLIHFGYNSHSCWIECLAYHDLYKDVMYVMENSKEKEPSQKSEIYLEKNINIDRCIHNIPPCQLDSIQKHITLHSSLLILQSTIQIFFILFN